MDELVKLVAQKTGIPEATARTAVVTVINFLKSKLPAPLASQIDSLLSDGGMGGLDDLSKGLGGILGSCALIARNQRP